MLNVSRRSCDVAYVVLSTIYVPTNYLHCVMTIFYLRRVSCDNREYSIVGRLQEVWEQNNLNWMEYGGELYSCSFKYLSVVNKRGRVHRFAMARGFSLVALGGRNYILVGTFKYIDLSPTMDTYNTAGVHQMYTILFGIDHFGVPM